MWKKRFVAAVLTAAMVLPTGFVGVTTDTQAATKGKEIELAKSASNPIAGFDASGNMVYGGDPSVLVDGDTVYLYVGHDASTDAEVNKAIYNMPEYLCYSSKDMVNWKAEGSVMKASTISWANNSTSAWASQVMKHNGKYYLYYCTWDKTNAGKQSIGVAVSDSPTGQFQDIGKPIVAGTVTEPQSSNWNDIDPTAWIETDSNGVEHRYLAWGNGKYYICELNEDMISVKDQNGDGKITSGTSTKTADIIDKTSGLGAYTEAPWLYRRQDANGNYTGKYYLFYASGWREKMAYVTTDDLMNGTWTQGGIIMEPTATSNTNHMAVFDFKGKTYFVYHNGSLPKGNGYRRVACVTELKFNADGSIQKMEETAAGLAGTKSVLYTNSGQLLGHENFTNSVSDAKYPYKKIKVGAGRGKTTTDRQWVFVAGKADKNKGAYVSVQSENKAGLYLTANADKTVTLAQDTEGTSAMAAKQTFISIEGLADSKGVSFESVSQPGYYLTIVNGTLALTKGSDAVAATFYTGTDASDASLRSVSAVMKKNQILAGKKLTKKSITVYAAYANGTSKKVTNFTTNVKKLNLKKAGKKTLKVTYKEGSVTKTTTVPVEVIKKPAKVKKVKVKVKVKKKSTKFNISWKKASGAVGYEITYGKTKKKHTALTTTKKLKTSYTDEEKEFKKGKTYYFHVRSYTKVNGKKVYSKYKTKAVKIK